MSKETEIREDFTKFTEVIWAYLKYPGLTTVQRDLCYYMQHGPKRCIAEAFRGVGKSFIAAVYCTWCWYNNPNLTILVISANKNRADRFSKFVQDLLKTIPILQHLCPRDLSRWSSVQFTVNRSIIDQSPSCMSLGLFGQMTGSRSDIVIADDVEVPNNSATIDARHKLLSAFLELEAIVKPGIGRILVLGTPQSVDSVYNELRDNRKYDMKVWPARIPRPDRIVYYKGNLGPCILKSGRPEMAPTDERFSENTLVQKEENYGRTGFTLQFMLDTSLQDSLKYPLICRDLIVDDLNHDKGPVEIHYSSHDNNRIKELACLGIDNDLFFGPLTLKEPADLVNYEASVMFIDPSGRGTNETGVVVSKLLHGTIFVTYAGGFRGGYSDLSLVKIGKVAQEQKPNLIIIESNFGQGMFESILKPVLDEYYPCSVETVARNTSKEMRIIDTLEPVMNKHRLVLDKSLVKKDYREAIESVDNDSVYRSLIYQLTHITRDKGCLRFDDRLDALAGSVEYWVKHMATNESKALERFKDKQRNEKLNRFLSLAKKQKRKKTMLGIKI